MLVPHPFPLIFSAYLSLFCLREREELLLICLAASRAFRCTHEASIPAPTAAFPHVSKSKVEGRDFPLSCGMWQLTAL